MIKVLAKFTKDTKKILRLYKYKLLNREAVENYLVILCFVFNMLKDTYQISDDEFFKKCKEASVNEQN